MFFVEVNTAESITNLSARAEADDQMRLRIRQLLGKSLTKLHGISAFGTKFCFYCLDKNAETVTAFHIPWSPAYVNDIAPANRWDTDILTADGYDRFMNVVAHVRVGAVAAFEGCVGISFYFYDR